LAFPARVRGDLTSHLGAAAGKSGCSPATTCSSASTPPADAPITTILALAFIKESPLVLALDNQGV
jgi:hypothetical protein